MKKETEENIKMIFGIFAIIGIFSTLIFIYNLFNKDNNTAACYEYKSEIEELESDIENLRAELSSEEYKNRGLENDLEICQEEYYLLEEDKGCSSSGTSDIKLTDGPSGK